MKECATFLENQPSKWCWRRLVTSNDRKQNASDLQKRLSDFVKKMQVCHVTHPKLAVTHCALSPLPTALTD